MTGHLAWLQRASTPRGVGNVGKWSTEACASANVAMTVADVPADEESGGSGCNVPVGDATILACQA